MPTISQRQREAIEDRVAQGVEANRLLGKIGHTCPTCGAGTTVLKERTQQVIMEARNWFRQPGSTKDDHVAVRYVAALAEIFDLEVALGYRVDAAARARETLHSHQTAEA